ncbi:hypothetical protein [Bartonella phoceensis]|uniref:hypothetical protein n=1 Tax=Bartonella phoceensis TaxID=270249 RepID=UPI001ABAB85F|nr:hypothetical protein [Bartonella phoceensis]
MAMHWFIDILRLLRIHIYDSAIVYENMTVCGDVRVAANNIEVGLFIWIMKYIIIECSQQAGIAVARKKPPVL